MTLSTLTGFVAGLLQFIVAAYALRLNRRYGTTRVGWSLFCAFSLLALLHLAQVVIVPSHVAVSFSAEVELTYALISVLLLIGMTHLEAMLKERVKMEQKEQQLRAELELEVKKKTAYLTRAIEGLQAEIDERKRMETVVQTADFELRAVSQQIELAGMANSILQSAGDLLQKINVSANHIASQTQQSAVAGVVRIGRLIREHLKDPAQFLTRHPEGRKLPEEIEQLSEQLTSEQTTLHGELDSLKTNLGKIIKMQQNYIRLAGTVPLTSHTATATRDQDILRSLCMASEPA